MIDPLLFTDRGVYAAFAEQLHKIGEGQAVDVQVNDVLVMKKSHPCGSREWKVTRVGMDFKLVCSGCGHQIMSPRSKIEKNIKKILRGGVEI